MKLKEFSDYIYDGPPERVKDTMGKGRWAHGVMKTVTREAFQVGIRKSAGIPGTPLLYAVVPGTDPPILSVMFPGPDGTETSAEAIQIFLRSICLSEGRIAGFGSVGVDITGIEEMVGDDGPSEKVVEDRGLTFILATLVDKDIVVSKLCLERVGGQVASITGWSDAKVETVDANGSPLLLKWKKAMEILDEHGSS